MSKTTRTIGLLALSGMLAVSAGAFVVLSDHRAKTFASNGIIVSAPSLPDNHTLDGEAVIDGALHPLNITEGGLSASGAPQALSLRLRDDRDRYYDMNIARVITLSGLAPRTAVSVSSGDTVAHDGIPADWNGRIVLDTPRTAPFDIAFTQNGHTYRIGIMARMGGSS